MRCLERNKQRFYYAKLLGKEIVEDEYGNLSGEYELQYGEPILAYGNISPACGDIQNMFFGTNENYDKVIVLEKELKGLDEHSVLWIDSLPKDEMAYDYVVKKIARSLNGVSIAVSRVIVSG